MPHGPLTRKSYPTYPCYCLGQGTFLINKHNHVKQADAEFTEILLRNENIHDTLGFSHIEDLLAPYLAPYLLKFSFLLQF